MRRQWIYKTLLSLLTIILTSFLVVYTTIPRVRFGVSKFASDIFNDPDEQILNLVASDELSVHFIESNTKFNGDAYYIKVNDIDILVDAGPRCESSLDIKAYLDNFIDDDVLEYLIVSHAHRDHISGLVGNLLVPGIFDFYQIKTIIDFPKTSLKNPLVTKYKNLVKREINEGATHYNALQCYQNTDGASRIIKLSENVEIEFLYNYYYDHYSKVENNSCVTFMINHKVNDEIRHMLFCGDIEKDAETKLIEYNNLPEIDLYKVNHHGSQTSSNEDFLSVIKPKIVTMMCCAGSDEYKVYFPRQKTINRIKKYTDKIYVTTVYDKNTKQFGPLNGTIVVSSSEEGLIVRCSNNDTLLKDTDWFKANLKW